MAADDKAGVREDLARHPDNPEVIARVHGFLKWRGYETCPTCGENIPR